VGVEQVAVASVILPWASAWRANAGWTIRHALAWAAAAWLGWLTFAVWPGRETAWAAVTLTAGAGIAVLGTRRPVVYVWHFLVASLMVVLWLGQAEGLLDGSGLKIGPFRLIFVGTLLAVGLGNYLPTRFGASAVALGVAVTALIHSEALWPKVAGPAPAWPALTAAGASWAAWLIGLRPAGGEWPAFRDRYGVVWAVRLREQFDAAAENRGWPVRLRWRGLTADGGPHDAAWHHALQALMKRFRTTGAIDPD
jgi:hypothetical protein